MCSGQLTGCGYRRVSWCRHLRVSRRDPTRHKEGPRHTTRGTPPMASLAERIMTTSVGYHLGPVMSTNHHRGPRSRRRPPPPPRPPRGGPPPLGRPPPPPPPSR